MSHFTISHHEQIGRDPHRWLVHVDGRRQPIPVELPDEERGALELTDEELDALLPTALERRQAGHPDDLPVGDEDADVSWDAPVRVFQTHFMG
jgi:hypothetical protein